MLLSYLLFNYFLFVCNISLQYCFCFLFFLSIKFDQPHLIIIVISIFISLVQEGRHEVLRTLTQNVRVDEAVDLRDLAARTDGYSPADLKSILVTAQLTRLENQLVSNMTSKRVNIEFIYIVVPHYFLFFI